MNWFGRYGIPGAYFIGLMAGWVYIFYPDLLKCHAWSDLQWLLALAGISFLPIGYVISIFSQVIYLNWRRWFARCRKVRGCLGFHGAAMDRVGGFQLIRDEAIIEARTFLLTASPNAPLSVDTHNYIRNWIARRMDVVAIDQSVICATFFAGIIAFVICRLQPGSPSVIAVIILSIISVFVIIAMVLSIMVLRTQVIEVIAGIYRAYFMVEAPDRD